MINKEKNNELMSYGWTEEEEQQLINFSEYMTVNEIADTLGKSPDAVSKKMKRLGLKSVSRWSKEEEEQLISLSEYMPAPEIAVILNRSTKAIIRKMQKMGLESVRSWTEEDENFLMDYWGFWQVDAIANMLNRSVKAVRRKAAELNLLSAKNEAGFFKLSDLVTVTGLSIYKIKSFEKKGLKIKVNYITRSSKYYYVEMEDLLDFLEKNQDLYSAANFDLSYFYDTPQWLKEKKLRDMKNPQRHSWTIKEKSIARQMFKEGAKIKDVAKILKVPEGTVRRLCYEK